MNYSEMCLCFPIWTSITRKCAYETFCSSVSQIQNSFLNILATHYAEGYVCKSNCLFPVHFSFSQWHASKKGKTNLVSNSTVTPGKTTSNKNRLVKGTTPKYKKGPLTYVRTRKNKTFKASCPEDHSEDSSTQMALTKNSEREKNGTLGLPQQEHPLARHCAQDKKKK